MLPVARDWQGEDQWTPPIAQTRSLMTCGLRADVVRKHRNHMYARWTVLEELMSSFLTETASRARIPWTEAPTSLSTLTTNHSNIPNQVLDMSVPAAYKF